MCPERSRRPAGGREAEWQQGEASAANDGHLLARPRRCFLALCGSSRGGRPHGRLQKRLICTATARRAEIGDGAGAREGAAVSSQPAQDHVARAGKAGTYRVRVDRHAVELDLVQRPAFGVDGLALHRVERRVDAVDHAPKDRVLAVERRLLGVGNEELPPPPPSTGTISKARPRDEQPARRRRTCDLFESMPELAMATTPRELNCTVGERGPASVSRSRRRVPASLDAPSASTGSHPRTAGSISTGHPCRSPSGRPSAP